MEMNILRRIHSPKTVLFVDPVQENRSLQEVIFLLCLYQIKPKNHKKWMFMLHCWCYPC